MIEPNTEDRAEAERIKKEYLKIQERTAIRGLISAKRAILLEESQALQSWLENFCLYSSTCGLIWGLHRWSSRFHQGGTRCCSKA